jgi:PPOX class probable F420-dependent enzyme
MSQTMVSIPDAFIDLLDRPIVVTLVTLMPNGQPQATPIWADVVDGRIRVNTVVGRQKYKNMKERPQVTVLAIDSENPYRWMEVRGEVTGESLEDGDAVIDKLSRDYVGTDYGDHRPENTRVNLYITPTRIVTSA